MEIKVLYFIPHLPAGGESNSILELFLSKMAEEVNVHIATLTPTQLPQGPYTTHCIGNGKANYGKHGFANLLSLQKRYLRLLYDLMPDVVHIHGSYSYLASRISRWSVQRNFQVVFSPNGGMSPEFIDAAYGERTWRLLTYQKGMSRKVTCIITTDEKEAEYIHDEHLNDRVELIEDPTAGEYLDIDGCVEQIYNIYQKVLASDKTLRLHQREREAVSALLHLSMAGEAERQPLCSEDILNLRKITPLQWRDIHLFAAEQGITGHVMEGISKAQLTSAANQVPDTDVFPSHTNKNKNQLESERLQMTSFASFRIKRKLKNADPTVRKICYMLLNIRKQLREHTLTLRQLCDLYETYRYEDIDEEKLALALRSTGLYSFACRISQVLDEIAYLDEGFMPVPALDDRGTARIRTHIMKDPTP